MGVEHIAATSFIHPFIYFLRLQQNHGFSRLASLGRHISNTLPTQCHSCYVMTSWLWTFPVPHENWNWKTNAYDLWAKCFRLLRVLIYHLSLVSDIFSYESIIFTSQLSSVGGFHSFRFIRDHRLIQNITVTAHPGGAHLSAPPPPPPSAQLQWDFLAEISQTDACQYPTVFDVRCFLNSDTSLMT